MRWEGRKYEKFVQKHKNKKSIIPWPIKINETEKRRDLRILHRSVMIQTVLVEDTEPLTRGSSYNAVDLTRRR